MERAHLSHHDASSYNHMNIQHKFVISIENIGKIAVNK